MSPFQVFLVTVMTCFLVATLAATFKGWATRREGVVWSAVWLAAALAAIWPDVTTRIAKALGIGRGANLVLYCAVVTMMIGFLLVYTRLRRLRRDVTLLTRHLAIRDAVTNRTPTHGSPDDDTPARSV